MNPQSFAVKLANIDCFKNRETLGRAVAGRVNLDGLISGRGKAMSKMIKIANKVRVCAQPGITKISTPLRMGDLKAL